jgi:hypothetical protein
MGGIVSDYVGKFIFTANPANIRNMQVHDGKK